MTFIIVNLNWVHVKLIMWFFFFSLVSIISTGGNGFIVQEQVVWMNILWKYITAKHQKYENRTVVIFTYISFSLYLMSRLRRIPASLRSPRRIMSSTPWMEVGCIGLMLMAFWKEIQCSWRRLRHYCKL